MLKCKYCSKECKNDNSLRNHERLCAANPDKQTTPFHSAEFQRNKTPNGGTNQFIKARSLGEPVPEVSAMTRQKIREANSVRDSEWHRENGERIRKTVNQKVAEGTWHCSLSIAKRYEYNGVILHGTWEVEYAKYLDANNIKWVRNTDRFLYVYGGKNRHYTPDFYLLATDEYIEIKGRVRDRDLAKWGQFPTDKKLVVLKRAELRSLGVMVK